MTMCKWSVAFRASLTNAAIVIMTLAVLAGCSANTQNHTAAPVPEIMPGILTGYLEQDELPNSLNLIPPPPQQGSTARAQDEAVNIRARALRDSPRFGLATRDAELSFPKAAETFSCALGIPISEKQTPHLYMLLRRTLADAGLSTYTAKTNYQRVRPFMENQAPTCTPAEEDKLRTDGSYPSGHTAVGWAWALILAEIAPEHADALLARGRAFGESRIICNVHWHSDVLEGRFMGAATVAKLHSDQAFLSDLQAAKGEYLTARHKGHKPQGDCREEAEILANNGLQE